MPVLVPKIQKLIQDERKRLIREQITPWIMGFSNGGLNIEDFNKRKISYKGILFKGSPQNVFWSKYIEPFLEDFTMRMINTVSDECEENNLDIEDEMGTLKQHLEGLYAAIFDEMAKADQNMRGKGYPEKIAKRSVSHEISLMNQFLEQHINMEIVKQKLCLKKRVQNFLKSLGLRDVFIGVMALIIGTALKKWWCRQYTDKPSWGKFPALQGINRELYNKKSGKILIIV